VPSIDHQVCLSQTTAAAVFDCEEQTMTDDTFHRLIEHGDVDGLRHALQLIAGLANRTIHWHLNRDNEPTLHFVSDCVGNGWLTNGAEGEIAELLLAFGAGSTALQAESPH